MESKWKIPGCVWSGYCRADRHRQNEIGWEGQSTFQKGESVDQLCQQDFAMSIILKSVSGVWHLHSSDCKQAADNEADDRKAERQAWDCLQGGLWEKCCTHDSEAYLDLFRFQKKSTVAVFRILPILSTSYVRTDQLPARVISLMWTSCVICIRWIIRNEILNFFHKSCRSLATIYIPIFQEIRAMLS